MIHHVVLFKFQSTISSEDIKAIEDGLLSMKSKVPDIVSLSVGKNFSERSQGFEFVLSVYLPSKEALASYQSNEYHQAVVTDYIKPKVVETLAVDYEFCD